MKQLRVFIAFFLIFTSFLSANHNLNTLAIFNLTIEQPFWSFESNIIRQKNETSFAEVIKKWTQKINDAWQDIAQTLEEEVGLSEDDLNALMHDQQVHQSYMKYQQEKYQSIMPTLIEEENIPTDIKNFIKGKVAYLEVEKPYKLALMKNMNLLSTSFGCDAYQHYLICNEKIYTAENVQDFFASTYTEHTNYFIEPNQNIHKTRCIELPNLLHLGIAEAVSGIIHQSHLLIFLLSHYEFNKQSVSDTTHVECFHFLQFRSFMEAALQTKNPLEAARFLQLKQDDAEEISEKYHNLWLEFTKDLENCYHEDDLDFYESVVMHVKRNAHNIE